MGHEGPLNFDRKYGLRYSAGTRYHQGEAAYSFEVSVSVGGTSYP